MKKSGLNTDLLGRMSSSLKLRSLVSLCLWRKKLMPSLSSGPVSLQNYQHHSTRHGGLHLSAKHNPFTLMLSLLVEIQSKNRAFSPHFPYLLEYFSQLFCLLKCLTITSVKKTFKYPSLLNFPLF